MCSFMHNTAETEVSLGNISAEAVVISERLSVTPRHLSIFDHLTRNETCTIIIREEGEKKDKRFQVIEKFLAIQL